ncbi:MAG: HipA domain-containing protein [Deltaproteobacteria bacterium]|nr:HipA domain-containing protein [Deltaproteobacteria bacterium]
MSGETNVLGVALGATEVGRLELAGGGLDRVRFSTTERYRGMADRPVLSQSLEDDLAQVWESRVRAPAFFSNLLPEGVLRELLAHRAGVNPMREFFLLAELGEDLPGNVIVRPVGRLADEGQASLELPKSVAADEPLRFSVAGLQLKFSVSRNRERWVLPVRGQGGRWLLKMPSPRFRRVPLNEYWMLRFARAVGLSVADVQLVRREDVEGLAGVAGPELAGEEPQALLVRRFDRTDGEARVHTEDLLQVLNKHPDDRSKYRAANAEWVGRLLRALDPSGEDLAEFVRRLIFNALLGNGDAHLKNWMLRYEHPQRPRLAPAFDLVSTIQYPATDQEEFALNVGRTKRYAELSLEHWRRFASHLHVPGLADVAEGEVAELVQSFAARLTGAWPAFAREAQVDQEFTATLERHWARVPLLRE